MKTPNEMVEFSSKVVEDRIMEAVKLIEAEYGGRVHMAAFVIYITKDLENAGMQAMETFGDAPHGWFDVAQAACHEALASTKNNMRSVPRSQLQ